MQQLVVMASGIDGSKMDQAETWNSQKDSSGTRMGGHMSARRLSSLDPQSWLSLPVRAGKPSLTSLSSNRAMVVKHRWRMILGLVFLWSASTLVTGYFVVQAYQGARGIEAKRRIKSRVFSLRTELAQLKAQRLALERKVAMLSGPVLDGDLLDERVRAELGRVNKNDLVIFIKDSGSTKNP